jgi:cyclin-dependent kinase regulatory subunit CKS1
MNNDENNAQFNDKNTKKNPASTSNATATATAIITAKNEGTNLKEYNNLMPKTIEEIKEIQARGRKLLIKRKYIKRSRFGLQNQQPKSEEELRIEKLQREKDIKELPQQIVYSNYYNDEKFEYRHVVLPKNLARWLPQNQILKQEQWIEIGVHQSSAWEHYMIYKPEPHILLFKREKDYLQKYGDDKPQYPPEQLELLKQQIQQQQQQQQQQELSAATDSHNTNNPSHPPPLTPPLLPAPAPLSPPHPLHHNISK